MRQQVAVAPGWQRQQQYITGVLYPRSALTEVRVLVVICVVVSWVGQYLLSRRRTVTPGS
ncbi:hypothetical protein ACFROC_23515 [Nocardia tengchongensis]|uniref:hypothetical protein n=1 Tax=Nocardia tengchongensis TaxID=2055889 RepID=UPI0036B398A9